MLYWSVSETHSSKTAASNFYLTNAICFQSGNVTTCKGDWRIRNFPNFTQSATAPEQTPDLPPEPTNAEIYHSIVLHYLGKAKVKGESEPQLSWQQHEPSAINRWGLQLQPSAQLPTDPLTTIWHQDNLSGKLSWLYCQALFQCPMRQYNLSSFLETLNQHSFTT